MHKSHEDQPVDRTFESQQNLAQFQRAAAPGRGMAKSSSQPVRKDRRKLISLLAIGTVGVVATTVTVGGVSLAHGGHAPWEVDDEGSKGSVSVQEHDDDWGERRRRLHKTPTTSKSPTPQPIKPPTPQPTKPPTPQPTKPPTATPTTAPTGTVIGSTTQATNSAVAFTNPADGQGGLLIHLSNGTWVACERSCTHQGAWVNYDPTTGQLVCPAHGAIFDPLTGCSHVSGPGVGPLTSVHFTVNANGTITTP